MKVEEGVDRPKAEGAPDPRTVRFDGNLPETRFLDLVRQDLRTHGGTIFEQGFRVAMVPAPIEVTPPAPPPNRSRLTPSTLVRLNLNALGPAASAFYRTFPGFRWL